MYHDASTESGSILIEVLFAIGILAVASLALMLAILFATKLGIRAHRQTIAGEIANQEIEILRHIPAAQLPLQANGPLIGTPQPPLTSLPAGSATLTITNYQADTNIRDVLVTISYQEGQLTRTLNFRTLMTIGGLNG